MSVEATWDLRSGASPKSLCVYLASTSTSASASISTTASISTVANVKNPSDDARQTNQKQIQRKYNSALTVVFGTERASLHARTFAPPLPKRRTPFGSPSGARTSTSQQPLSASNSGQRNFPKAYLPADLAGGSLEGPIVSIIRASTNNSATSTTTAASITQSSNSVLLLLVDDNRGSAASSKATIQSGAYVAHLVSLQKGAFAPLPHKTLPRMSCACFDPRAGFVHAAGRTVKSIFPDAVLEKSEDSYGYSGRRTLAGRHKRIVYQTSNLPPPGARSGQDALALICHGRVAIVAVGNSFYAVPGFISEGLEDKKLNSTGGGQSFVEQTEITKVISFSQSSQVHPVIVLDINDTSLDDGWSCVFCASGRECAVVDIHVWENPGGGVSVSCSPPRHNTITTLASPILAASCSWPFVAVLTSDGLISVRSPSCLAIPLRTVEVGTRPNDYFVLRTLRDDKDEETANIVEPITAPRMQPWLVAISYSGEGKVLQCQPDTAQDLADRLMRLSIDAFGANGFPRSELAEALNASFTSTSYVGPEPTPHAKSLLRQYLEAVLGLADFDSGGKSGWPTEMELASSKDEVDDDHHYGAFDEAGRTAASKSTAMVSSASPTALVSGSALLCLVCSQLTPPNASLANRTSKECASKLGVVFAGDAMPASIIGVGESIAEKLLREASNVSLLRSSSPIPIGHSHQSAGTEFVEAAVWLLRSCGKHERAIEIMYDRLHQHHKGPDEGGKSGAWSQIKYESYTATHLSELWSSGEDLGCRLVLRSSATRRLLENNPRLGLSVFTAMHPQNENQWKSMWARDDPLAHPSYPLQVVELLKSVNPAVPYDAKDTSFTGTSDEKNGPYQDEGTAPLSLESGRALAVAYLESAIGISNGRPSVDDAFDSLPQDESFEERKSNLHDELAYLLLEGVIAELGDEDNDTDTELGRIYRGKLRCLLRWSNTQIHSDRILSSLPATFLQEHALLLGRLGRHEDALRMLYGDLQSLDLALEYCDARHERQRAQIEQDKIRRGGTAMSIKDCAYLPLVRVALQADPDAERGTTAAIQVLALRSGSIDRSAALRLLPHNVPVSAVARPFLIPALVDSESQVRRLKVAASLLRAKYLSLKKQLTEAQIKSQSNLHTVPALRSSNLGDPLHSSKPFKARPAHSASSTFPEVIIVKHFFPRHLLIQAKVSNSAPSLDGRTLNDVAFVVAESSEEAIQANVQVPLKALPFGSTGSAWCLLAAAPQRMDGTAILACELRYTISAVDAKTGAPLNFSGATSGMGRVYVEELEDMDVHVAHFLS